MSSLVPLKDKSKLNELTKYEFSFRIKEMEKIKRQENQNKLSPEELISQRSRIAHQRVSDANEKNKHKSRFDYITILMAVLMALVTIFGIVIGLLTVR